MADLVFSVVIWNRIMLGRPMRRRLNYPMLRIIFLGFFFGALISTAFEIKPYPYNEPGKKSSRKMFACWVHFR